MYTQVVDELLDIQLEFEEKLADAEDQGRVDLDNLRAELDEDHQRKMQEVNQDLEKHKEAIGKLSERLKKSQEMVARGQKTTPTASAPSLGTASSEELQKLQEKFDQL